MAETQHNETDAVDVARPVSTRREAIRAIRRAIGQLPIAAAALCGSFARDEQGPESDVDVLVSFAPGARLSDVETARDAFERETGRSVDIITSLDGQSARFRDSIFRGAVRIYG